MRPARLLLLGLALALSGCSTAADDRAGAPTPAPTALIAPEDMEQPTPGVVEVDGDDPLSGLAGQGFAATRPGRDVTVAQEGNDDATAFERLCLGEIDVVTSRRAIDAGEAAACRANGLDVVPFQVAADATVVAVGSGADVGTDCLTTDQVSEAFEGSAGTWADLDPRLAQEPLRTATRPDDAANLDLVAGSPTDREQALALPGLRAEWDTAVVNFKAQRRWHRTAQSELAFARAERRRGIEQDRPPAERANDDARLQRAETELDRAREAWLASKRVLGGIEPRLADAEGSEEALARSRGTLGRFSAGFARDAGDLLQPFAVARDDDCVLPTDETVANGTYPLAEQLMVTATSRSLARPEVAAFVRFQLESAGELAQQAGVVPLPADQITEQVGWLDDGELPGDSRPSEPERPAQ